MSALAAAAAARPDWVARWIAIVGVLLALGSLLNTRHLWRKEGPLLTFDLVVRAYRQPGTEVVHRIRAQMEVANVGRMAATVRAAELCGPGSTSFVLTDITQGSGGSPVLQPTDSLVSNGIDFAAPDEAVREALQRPPPADLLAEEFLKTMRPKLETLVRGRVRRGDGHSFNKARNTVIVYRDEPWPGLESEK